MLLERIAHTVQGKSEVVFEQGTVGKAFGDFSQRVHVVRRDDQPGALARDLLERPSHEGGADDLAQRADVGRPGRAETGAEENGSLVWPRLCRSADIFAESVAHQSRGGIAVLPGIARWGDGIP